jgi:hypothetical protein
MFPSHDHVDVNLFIEDTIDFIAALYACDFEGCIEAPLHYITAILLNGAFSGFNAHIHPIATLIKIDLTYLIFNMRVRGYSRNPSGMNKIIKCGELFSSKHIGNNVCRNLFLSRRGECCKDICKFASRAYDIASSVEEWGLITSRSLEGTHIIDGAAYDLQLMEHCEFWGIASYNKQQSLTSDVVGVPNTVSIGNKSFNPPPPCILVNKCYFDDFFSEAIEAGLPENWGAAFDHGHAFNEEVPIDDSLDATSSDESGDSSDSSECASEDYHSFSPPIVTGKPASIASEKKSSK